MQMHSPVHPGVILREYMGEALTVSRLAKHLGMTRANLSMILNGRLGVTAATALKLSEAFPNSRPDTWLAIQAQYDIAKERKKKRRKIEPVELAAA